MVVHGVTDATWDREPMYIPVDMRLIAHFSICENLVSLVPCMLLDVHRALMYTPVGMRLITYSLFYRDLVFLVSCMLLGLLVNGLVYNRHASSAWLGGLYASGLHPAHGPSVECRSQTPLILEMGESVMGITGFSLSS